MRMLRIGSIVIRVDNLERQMSFWQAALGYEPRYAPDGDFVILQPPGGAGTCISLDRVPAAVRADATDARTYPVRRPRRSTNRCSTRGRVVSAMPPGR